jgi:hypothetical protein
MLKIRMDFLQRIDLSGGPVHGRDQDCVFNLSARLHRVFIDFQCNLDAAYSLLNACVAAYTCSDRVFEVQLSLYRQAETPATAR